MSKNNKPTFGDFVPTDSELLDKMLFFLGTLRPFLPSDRLKDCAAGACALIFDLSNFLYKNNLKDYGNHSK